MRFLGLLSRTVILIAAVLPACSSGANEDWVSATLTSSDAVCAGQHAMVPASRAVTRTLTSANAQTLRQPTTNYVAYQMISDELFTYLAFADTLPAQFSTQEARDQLAYAYVIFKMKEPASAGGSLEILESSDLLHLADFEVLEVRDGQLVWRLRRQSAEHYIKWLSSVDADPTNDPPPGEACFFTDVGGMCACDFSGPAIDVTIDGAQPL